MTFVVASARVVAHDVRACAALPGVVYPATADGPGQRAAADGVWPSRRRLAVDRSAGGGPAGSGRGRTPGRRWRDIADRACADPAEAFSAAQLQQVELHGRRPQRRRDSVQQVLAAGGGAALGVVDGKRQALAVTIGSALRSSVPSVAARHWELGRTQLGYDEASNGDYSNADYASDGYGGGDWGGGDI